MTTEGRSLLDADEFNHRIGREFGQRACWKAGLVVGSMVVLDFGSRRTLIGRGGRAIALGETSLSVRNVSWFVEQNSRIVLTSDMISPDNFFSFESAFIGRALQRLEWGLHCSLIFSDGVVLRCDRTNAYDNDGDEILELRFLNDDYVDCFADGLIELESSPE